MQLRLKKEELSSAQGITHWAEKPQIWFINLLLGFLLLLLDISAHAGSVFLHEPTIWKFHFVVCAISRRRGNSENNSLIKVARMKNYQMSFFRTECLGTKWQGIKWPRTKCSGNWKNPHYLKTPLLTLIGMRQGTLQPLSFLDQLNFYQKCLNFFGGKNWH